MIDPQEKQKQLKDYEDSLEGKTLEELEALEQEVIKEAEDVDTEVSNSTFDLPKENYEKVAKAIHMILGKKSVQWQLTLGLVAMYDFWDEKNFPETVSYPMLDGTLRTLGESTFTGYDEWAAVVIINKYFEPIRDKYLELTEKAYDVAAKHNILIDKIQKNTPIGEVQTIDNK